MQEIELCEINYSDDTTPYNVDVSDFYAEHDLIKDQPIDPSSKMLYSMHTKFVKVDRNEENKKVLKYQKTGDEDVLMEVYNSRIPSLQIWARRYSYLREGSKEDMFGDLTQVFLKTIHGYKHKHNIKYKGKTIIRYTPFNTYLFYALDNYVKNIISSKNAKKRTPVGSKPSLTNKFIVSYDAPHPSMNGTFKELVLSEIEDASNGMEKMFLEETIALLSNNDPHITKFLHKLSNGNNISSALKSFKIQEDCIKINDKELSLGKNKKLNLKLIKQFIKDKQNIPYNFKILNYQIIKNTLQYTIELPKTQESDKIMKRLRKIKKNKDFFKDILRF